MASTPLPGTMATQSNSSPRPPSNTPSADIPLHPLSSSAQKGAPKSAMSLSPGRRPTLNPITTDGQPARGPSVQFVPHVRDSLSGSRSSSARPASSINVSLAGSIVSGRPGTAHRMSSPPPPQIFSARVSFDTFDNRDASDFSLTLNRKHRDYEYTRRSRTFLCGTDMNDYSDLALEWLIDELVDDGDEIVCLRVVEADSKEALKWSGGRSGSGGHKGYRQEAERMLEGIQAKNKEDKAINLVLEFSVGKVPDTIQHMIRVYEPAILVVGTRGRDLTGYKGLLSSGSVSKYCLQYSPVPVIVVRPSSKREKKKRKRMQNPSRGGYRDILDKSEDAPRGRGGHLLDEQNRTSVVGGEMGVLGELGSRDPDEEARMVAEAIGYRGGGGVPGAGSASASVVGEPLAKSISVRSDVSGRSGRSVSLGSETGNDLTSPVEPLRKSPDLRTADGDAVSDLDYSDDDDENADLGQLLESVVLRPEEEAAMLAYERAQVVVEEEAEAAAAREEREKDRAASRGRRGGRRSASRGRDDDGEDQGGGAAVLGLLSQLDGMEKKGGRR